MINCNFRLLLAFLAILGTAAAGCASDIPATPAVPAAGAKLPGPTTQSSPPPAQQTAPPTGSLPAVNYFTVTSDSVPANTVIILLWSVSGASSISIDNGIGKVDAHGRYAVIPAASTTYTLTATNASGGVTAQVAVDVSQLTAGSPHYLSGYKLLHIPLETVNGSPTLISLDTQTSRGYKWVVDYYDATMVSYVGANYISKNPLTRGVDGQEQFTFKPLKVGDTRILVSDINDQTPTQFESIIYDVHIKQH
jgi:Chagasin family peptidase inhibitor I42